MISSNSPTKSSESITLDASVVINLNATKDFAKILSLLPYTVNVTNHVVDELRNGESLRGHSDFSQLISLVNEGLVKIVSLEPYAASIYLSLVNGSAFETLDDGEASTISFALQTNCIAAIDERKALHLCTRKFSQLQTCNSLDLILHPNVAREFSDDTMSDLVFNALSGARMRVPSNYIAQVIDLIGDERTRVCPSLSNQKTSR